MPDHLVLEQPPVLQNRLFAHARVPLWQQPEADSASIPTCNSLGQRDGLIDGQRSSKWIKLGESKWKCVIVG